MNKLRLRFGLRWPGKIPPLETVLDWLIVGLILLGVLVVQGVLDEKDAAASTSARDARHATSEARKFRDLFDRCLNGGMVGRSGSTALICKGAEETDLGKIQLICPVKGACK